MRVLFVLGFPNPFPGAAWTRIGFFSRRWAQQGNEVEVLGTFTTKVFSKRGSKSIDSVRTLNLIVYLSILDPLVFVLNFLAAVLTSTLVIFARRPHVAIVSVPPGDVGLGALIACRIARVKSVVDYRDQWEDHLSYLSNSKVGKFVYFFVDRIAASLYSKSRFAATVTPGFVSSLRCRGATDIRLIPNGADIRTFKPSGNKRNGHFTAFYSGGVWGYYRLDVVVKAVKHLADMGIRNMKLVIAGQGDVQNILNLSHQLGVSEEINYFGATNNRAELARHIAQADVGLIPFDDNPLWKTFIPAKFFEYCACGIPTVATVYKDSLLAKMIKEHELGLTVPPMDEKSLAEAIYRAYKDKPFRDTAGKNARALIEEKFDRAKISDIFLGMVEQVAQN